MAPLKKNQTQLIGEVKMRTKLGPPPQNGATFHMFTYCLFMHFNSMAVH